MTHVLLCPGAGEVRDYMWYLFPRSIWHMPTHVLKVTHALVPAYVSIRQHTYSRHHVKRLSM